MESTHWLIIPKANVQKNVFCSSILMPKSKKLTMARWEIQLRDVNVRGEKPALAS